MTSVVPGEDHSAETVFAVNLLPLNKSLLVSPFDIPLSVLLPVFWLPVASQPASRTGSPAESIAHPVNPMNTIVSGSSAQHLPTVSLHDCDTYSINASFALLRVAHAPDPASSVRDFFFSNRGRSTTGWALDFLRE